MRNFFANTIMVSAIALSLVLAGITFVQGTFTQEKTCTFTGEKTIQRAFNDTEDILTTKDCGDVSLRNFSKLGSDVIELGKPYNVRLDGVNMIGFYPALGKAEEI